MIWTRMDKHFISSLFTTSNSWAKSWPMCSCHIFILINNKWNSSSLLFHKLFHTSFHLLNGFSYLFTLLFIFQIFGALQRLLNCLKSIKIIYFTSLSFSISYFLPSSFIPSNWEPSHIIFFVSSLFNLLLIFSSSIINFLVLFFVNFSRHICFLVIENTLY